MFINCCWYRPIYLLPFLWSLIINDLSFFHYKRSVIENFQGPSIKVQIAKTDILLCILWLHVSLQLKANWRKSNQLKHQPMFGFRLQTWKSLALYDAKNQPSTHFIPLQKHILVSSFHPLKTSSSYILLQQHILLPELL